MAEALPPVDILVSQIDAPGEAHAHSNHIHLFQFFGHVVLLDYSMLDRDTGGTFSNVSLVMRYV